MGVGNSIEITAHRGKFSFEAGCWDRVIMLCGGTGIAPMWQVAHAALADPHDATMLTLVIADRKEADVLLKGPLDKAVETARGRLTLVRVLSKPSFRWTGARGHIDAEKLQSWWPPATTSATTRTAVLISGPPAFDRAVAAAAAQLAGPRDLVHVL